MYYLMKWGYSLYSALLFGMPYLSSFVCIQLTIRYLDKISRKCWRSLDGSSVSPTGTTSGLGGHVSSDTDRRMRRQIANCNERRRMQVSEDNIISNLGKDRLFITWRRAHFKGESEARSNKNLTRTLLSENSIENAA